MGCMAEPSVRSSYGEKDECVGKDWSGLIKLDGDVVLRRAASWITGRGAWRVLVYSID